MRNQRRGRKGKKHRR